MTLTIHTNPTLTQIAISPRCACDVPAHIYTYSFEPKTNWSSVYAGSHEIHQYFEDFARKYELYQYIQVQHQVTGARWDETSGEWEVRVQRRSDGEIITDRCHVLVNCTGALNTWKWPDIPGLHTFKGDLLQTAKWDQNVVLKDKVVGLIGNGSVSNYTKRDQPCSSLFIDHQQSKSSQPSILK